MEISRILQYWADIKPESLAVVEDEHEITFAQLNSNARRIANLLQINSFKSGDLVCTMLPSIIDWQVTIALQMLGITSFSKPLGTQLPADLMPDWIISTEIIPNFPEDQTIVADDNFAKAVNQTREIESTPGFASQESPARYFYTSGTSGAPKYLLASAGRLKEKGKGRSASELAGSREFLSLMKFGSSQGYRAAVRALMESRPVFFTNGVDFRLPKMLLNYPIQTISGSPIQISSLLDILDQTGTKIPGVKAIVMSGSRPSNVQIDRIRKFGNIKVFNVYGSTELGFVSIHEIKERVEAPGVLSPNVKLEIVDIEGNSLPRGQVGIVRYKKIDSRSGYVNDAKATAEFFKDGFFYPGDLGFLDSKGGLTITGRSNEVINLGGVKINPSEIEDAILAVEGVIDCAAFGAQDPNGVNRLLVAVVKRETTDLESIDKQTKEIFKKIAVSYFFEVKEIPRNENGKIIRAQLPKLIPEIGKAKIND